MKVEDFNAEVKILWPLFLVVFIPETYNTKRTPREIKEDKEFKATEFRAQLEDTFNMAYNQLIQCSHGASTQVTNRAESCHCHGDLMKDKKPPQRRKALRTAYKKAS